jgi:hypothetical protein
MNGGPPDFLGRQPWRPIRPGRWLWRAAEAARLTVQEKRQLWERQILNPYIHADS